MEGHLSQRGKSKTWYLVYDEPTMQGQKRRQRWVRIGRMSKSGAQESAREILRQIDEGTWTDNRKRTVADLLNTWLKDNEHRLAAKTWEGYESKLRCHIIPAIGEIPLAKLKPKHVVDAYAAIRAKDLSARTLVHIHRILHAALNYGKKTLRAVKENVASSVPSPGGVSRELAPLREEHVRTIIEAARGTRLEVPVLVAALTGLRRSEILALGWKRSVDLQRGVFAITHVLEQSRRYGVRLKAKTKSRSSRRVIPLANEVVEVLKAHRARQDDDRKRLGHAYVENDLVFCNEDGTPWPPDTFTKQFADIARLVGMKGSFRFHDARHAFASLTLKNGAPVKEVSALLGHASPMLTLSTYARVIEGMGREAVNGLAESLLMKDEGEPFR